MVDIVPVDVPEERVRHDLLSIRRARSKTQLWLTSEQFLEDGDGVSRHMDWIKWLVGKNRIVDLIFILSTERRLLEEHLVDKHAERPPVNGAAIFLIQKNL